MTQFAITQTAAVFESLFLCGVGVKVVPESGNKTLFRKETGQAEG